MEQKTDISVPVSTINPAEFTDDLIPAIRANVVRKRIWRSIWSLLIWGIFNLFIGFSVIHFERHDFAFQETSLLDAVLSYGVFVIALVMVLCSLYGMVTRDVRIILVDGGMVGLIGLWNIGVFILGLAFGLEEVLIGNVFWGVIQVFWGIKEFRKHKRIASWAKETADLPKASLEQVKAILRTYRKAKEEFFAGRLWAQVALKKDFFAETRGYYYGKINQDAGILVSAKMDGYFRINWEDAKVSSYKKEGRVNFFTEFGEIKVQFGPLSALAWKKWAEVPILPDDLKRLVRRKELSLEILRVFMHDDNPEVRKTVIQLLPKLRKKSGFAETLGGMLEDKDTAVCVSVLAVCIKVKADSLHEKIYPLLQSNSDEVRRAAVKYMASCPQPEAIDKLTQVMSNEPNESIFRQFEKALLACEKAKNKLDDSNPYAWD